MYVIQFVGQRRPNGYDNMSIIRYYSENIPGCFHVVDDLHDARFFDTREECQELLDGNMSFLLMYTNAHHIEIREVVI